MPVEDPRCQEGDGTAELAMSLYGTQDAAANWEAEYTKTLLRGGFVQGLASGCHFFHAATKVKLMVHGDDFVAVGDKAGLDGTEKTLLAAYECKVQRLGWQRGMARQARILGRIVSLHDDGVDVEPDPALIEEAVGTMGLTGGKGVSTPAVAREFFPKLAQQDLTKLRISPQGTMDKLGKTAAI